MKSNNDKPTSRNYIHIRSRTAEEERVPVPLRECAALSAAASWRGTVANHYARLGPLHVRIRGGVGRVGTAPRGMSGFGAHRFRCLGIGAARRANTCEGRAVFSASQLGGQIALLAEEICKACFDAEFYHRTGRPAILGFARGSCDVGRLADTGLATANVPQSCKTMTRHVFRIVDPSGSSELRGCLKVAHCVLRAELRPDFGRLGPFVRPFWPRSHRNRLDIWPIWTISRPNLAKCWPTSAELVRHWPKLGQIWPALANAAEIRPKPGSWSNSLRQLSGNYAQLRSSLGSRGEQLSGAALLPRRHHGPTARPPPPTPGRSQRRRVCARSSAD